MRHILVVPGPRGKRRAHCSRVHPRSNLNLLIRLQRYTQPMANQNEFAGVFPKVIHPINDGETAITEYVEKIEGEVALDSYVKAQTSAPEVVKRITKLETCLQQLASAAVASLNGDSHTNLRAADE